MKHRLKHGSIVKHAITIRGNSWDTTKWCIAGPCYLAHRFVYYLQKQAPFSCSLSQVLGRPLMTILSQHKGNLRPSLAQPCNFRPNPARHGALGRTQGTVPHLQKVSLSYFSFCCPKKAHWLRSCNNRTESLHFSYLKKTFVEYQVSFIFQIDILGHYF